MKNEIIILLLFFWEKWIMISLFMRILKSFFSSLLLCIWPRPCLPRKKKLVPVRDFKTFPKVKTFFSFSTPNRLFFFLFKHGLFQQHKSNAELIVWIILIKNENHNSFFQKSFVTKIEKMKIFSVSQTKIDFLFSFETLSLSTTQGSWRNYGFWNQKN